MAAHRPEWLDAALWLITIVVAIFFTITVVKVGHAYGEWLEGIL